MVVQLGQCEIAADALNHVSFRQRLSIEGHTTYRISLCKLESRAQEVCHDEPVTRTRSVQKLNDKMLEGVGTKIIDPIHNIWWNFTPQPSNSRIKAVQKYCRIAEENAK